MPLAGTPDQIREIDRRAIEEYGLPGVVLMENAGRGAAELALKMLGEACGALVAILCGRGNNGGDGFVVARHLHNAGARVETFLTARAQDIPENSDAGVNLHVARRMGIPLTEIASAPAPEPVLARLGEADLLVDALLGTGLSGEVREPARSLIEWMNARRAPVLAIDTPSGLDGETGEPLGVAVRADCTATFAAAKVGFFRGSGPQWTGAVHVVDIGVPKALLAGFESADPHAAKQSGHPLRA